MCLSLTEIFHVLIVLFFWHTCKLVQLLCIIAYIKELLVLPKRAQGFYKDLSWSLKTVIVVVNSIEL